MSENMQRLEELLRMININLFDEFGSIKPMIAILAEMLEIWEDVPTGIRDKLVSLLLTIVRSRNI